MWPEDAKEFARVISAALREARNMQHKRNVEVSVLPFGALLEPAGGDFRGEPTLVCPCGCDMFLMAATFDPLTRLPGFYLLDGRCASCGSWVTLPTDHPDETFLERLMWGGEADDV